jgi:hypothetical protein
MASTVKEIPPITTNVKESENQIHSTSILVAEITKIPTNVKIIQIKSTTSEGEKNVFLTEFFSGYFLHIFLPPRLICYHPRS